MARKWGIRVLAMLMVPVIMFSAVYLGVNSFTAQAVTQSQIDALKKQQKEILQKKQENLSAINSLEYEQSTALAKKSVLDAQIDLTEEDIVNISAQIETYTLLIKEKEQEVKQAQQTENEQWAYFKVRMRAMEENGAISYIAVIFDADSFADLLARMDIVSEIMQYDENLYKELKAAKQATIDAQASLITAKADQEEQKADLLLVQAELESQVAEADALLDKLAQDIDAAKELQQQEEAAAKKIQDDIKKAEAALKKQQSGQVKGTGTFAWPTPSCYIVTRPYGRQKHPIYRDIRMHYGIDIGAKYGANIIASDSGTVIISAYSSSYGHYIVLSHGNGKTTLYAHMSTRIAKVGAKVSKGDTIGKVGSTGASTGPHLHFEITIDGASVDPLSYFSGYTKDY